LAAVHEFLVFQIKDHRTGGPAADFIRDRRIRRLEISQRSGKSIDPTLPSSILRPVAVSTR
jgi:hypothetical protein